MVKVSFMRGLQNFIEEIHACENKEQEERRVEKELAKIREKFGDGDKGLTGYDKRKYVWKLLYIYILGYKVDFGHRQACDLIPKPKYKDKQVGYMACTILLSENDEFLRLAINGVHQDLVSRNESFECLALNFVGSVGGQEMAEALTPDILKLLNSGSSRPMVKKKAALCLLRMMHKTPADQQLVNPDTFCSCLNALLEERDVGLLLSSVTLLCGMVARSGIAGYEPCQSRVLRILERLVLNPDKEKDIPIEYLYYGIPSPWLQSKALRVLQYFPPPEVAAEREMLINILQAILASEAAVEQTKLTSANKNNALYSVIFEAIYLALHLDLDEKLLSNCVATLGKLLTTKEPNVKYLALESLTRLAGQPDVVAAVRAKLTIVSAALREPDVATRKRALDLLFAVCNASNARELVAELLDYLITADFAMREELVLKIAILAEKHAPDVRWYVDTLFRLLESAGDFVGDEIWQRVAQLVTNNESMQEYAANQIVEVLRRGATYESVACTAAYLLGEYGRLIRAAVPCQEQYRLLHEHFVTAGHATKALLMSAFLKIYLQDYQNQALRDEVLGAFDKCQKLMDAELQQRAAEYKVLATTPQSAATKFLLPMPKWPERESTLLRQLQKQEGGSEELAPAAAAMSGVRVSQSTESGILSASSSIRSPAAGERLPSINLLGSEASVASATSVTARDPFDVLASASSGPAPAPAPPASNNPLDLLADLFAGPSAAAPVAQPVPPAPAAMPQAAPPGLGAAPGFGAASGFGAAPSAHTQSFGQPAFSAPAAAPTAHAQPAAAWAPPATYGAAAPHGAGPGAPYQGGAPAAAWPGSAAPAPLVPPAPSSVAFAASDDPFGDAAFAQPPVPAAPPIAVVFEPARPLGDLQAWFTALLNKDRGLLYEDQYIQVGAQLHYANGKGDLTLFLGNKNAEHPLQNLSLTARSCTSVHAALLAAPAQLLPKQQLQVPVTLTCLGPVVDLPVVNLGYVLGNVAVSQDLAVPMSSSKFIMPEPTIPKHFFFDQWKAISSNPACKAQQMVARAAGALTHEAVVSIMRQASLGVEHCYLDPSPYNEAGAGYYVCGMPGQQQRLLVMSRVEGNPQNMAQFRVTVVSAIPALSNYLKDVLAASLAA